MSSILTLQIKQDAGALNGERLNQNAQGDQTGSEGSVFVAFSGFIHDLGDPDGEIQLDAQQLARRFQKEGVDITCGLWGRYNMIVVDMAAGCVYTFQDWLGGPYPMLISNKNKVLSVSDSMLWLLNQYDKWEMDDETAAKFLKEGRVYGPGSLVRGIYKQPPAEYGVADIQSGEIRFCKAHYKFPKDKVHSASEYVEALERSLKDAVRDKTDVGCALSGGYDSNLSLNRLRDFWNEPVTAFTVGGVVGSDERPAASRIAAQYKDVRLVQGVVEPEILQEFPKIVYQLEGALYERGVFLQYVLSRMAMREKVKTMVLSEGADQVLCPLVRVKHWPGNRRPPREFRPYDMVSLTVMPKNSLMFRNTGVTPCYPYLRERYLRATRSLYMKNRMFKRYHKAAVLKTLPQGVSSELQKIGGTTQAQALFGEALPFEQFKARALSLRWHNPEVPILVSAKSPLEGEMDYCLKLMYLYLFEQICLKHSDEQSRKAAAQKPLSEYVQQIQLKAAVPALKTRINRTFMLRVYWHIKRFL